MTTYTPRLPNTPVLPDLASDAPAPASYEQQSAPLTGAFSGIALRLWRPTSTAVVVHVAGDLDAASAPRLHELLAPRLTSMVETVVLDFSALEFMGVAGLELLAHVRQRAAHRAMRVCLVDGPPCVERALRAAGWAETVPTYSTPAAAVADLSGRDRENTLHAAG